MSSELIILMLLAACAHAAWNAVIKGGTNKLYETGLNVLGGATGVVFILPFVPPPALETWFFLFISVCIHIAYYLCIAIAYRQSEMSYAYTLMRGSTPLFTAFVLSALGQGLSDMGWIGVLCLCAGVLALASQNLLDRTFDKYSTLAALGNSIVITGYTLVDGFGVRSSGNAMGYVCWLYFLNAFPLNLVILSGQHREYGQYLIRRWKAGLFGGLCSLAGYGVALWGMTQAPIQLVAALRETSVIFGMLLSVCFLGERFTQHRLAAVILVTSGTVIMRLA